MAVAQCVLGSGGGCGIMWRVAVAQCGGGCGSAPSYVQILDCTKMALQFLNIQGLNIQNLEYTTPWMYKNLNAQKLECTNLISKKP